jgi:hypothetical protein
VIETATLIGGHLAVTAKHVIEAVTRKLGARQVHGGAELGFFHWLASQLFPPMNIDFEKKDTLRIRIRGCKTP